MRVAGRTRAGVRSRSLRREAFVPADRAGWADPPTHLAPCRRVAPAAITPIDSADGIPTSSDSPTANQIRRLPGTPNDSTQPDTALTLLLASGGFPIRGVEGGFGRLQSVADAGHRGGTRIADLVQRLQKRGPVCTR